MKDCKYRTEDCDNATICPCLMYNMRDATKEEQDGVNNYIKSISTPTGIVFESPYIDKEELDRIVDKLNAIGNINPVLYKDLEICLNSAEIQSKEE